MEVAEECNACFRVVDRQAVAMPDSVALVHRAYDGQRTEVTYAQLRSGAARFAGVLDMLHVGPGERVCVLLDPRPDFYCAFLGTLRAAAVAVPVFAQMGTAAIHDRLADSGAVAAVTAAPYLEKLLAAAEGVESLRHVLVAGSATEATAHCVASLDSLLAEVGDNRPVTPVDIEAPMLIHYSSGTTGPPKGVLHVHAAVEGHERTAEAVLGLSPGDRYWCTADPGWVTGTSYGVFGPWARGVTQIAYSGGFRAETWYEILGSEKVEVWYTSPTALRMLMRDGADLAQDYDLSHLHHVASVGEPLNPEVIRWAREAYGHTVHDTWWQTETGCIQIANAPGSEVKPGSMGRPLGGVSAGILDPATHEPLEPDREGLLALRPPWPSMFRAYWGQPAKYAEKIQAGWYLTGDRAWQDADGYYWFVGRDDDVINTSGHLVGPFEIESALIAHEAVVEAAAFPVPDEGAGEVVVAKVVLAPGFEGTRQLVRDLKTAVGRSVGPHAAPREVVIVDGLPRTRSGKILRRVARAEHLGLPVGDTSSLED